MDTDVCVLDYLVYTGQSLFPVPREDFMVPSTLCEVLETLRDQGVCLHYDMQAQQGFNIVDVDDKVVAHVTWFHNDKWILDLTEALRGIVHGKPDCA